MGRDLSIFQIGESQNRFGVHSNLGTNIHRRAEQVRQIRVGGRVPPKIVIELTRSEAMVM